MLVLSRKEGETIVVDQGHITFKILEIRGDKVRVGVEAPPDVSVDRQEVWLSKQQEQAHAVCVPEADLVANSA